MRSTAFSAMLFAREVHKDHKRKYTGNPYADHLAEVEGLMGEGGVDYLRAVTSRPLDDLLFAYLVRRERLRGMR